MSPSFAKVIILLCFVALIGVPLAVRPPEGDGSSSGDEGEAQPLIIITPHNEQIRFEFKQAFEAWHWRVHGSGVEVIYTVPGGTSEIRRLLESQFRAALEDGRAAGGEADLVFGGGSYEHNEFKKPITVMVDGESRTTRISMPVRFDQAWLEKTYGVNEIGGKHGSLYDPDGHWFGLALSGFGIVFNREALKACGVDEPDDWQDLCDPRLQGWVALVNPNQSGSVKTAFESIIHREGWRQGWRILRRAAANARYFSASSLKPPMDVTQGNAAMGVAIDFYGRFQSQALKEAGDPDRVGYVDPRGGGSIDADPISMLTGAPHPELARRFIEFALSDEGQALWQFPRRDPRKADAMGPVRFELRRLVITRGMYERHGERFIDTVDPFAIATPPAYPDANVRDFISPLFAGMAMDCHHELREAWKAIASHPAFQHDALVDPAEVSDASLRRMLELFDAMPEVEAPRGAVRSMEDASHLAELRAGWIKGGWREEGLWPQGVGASPVDELRRRFGEFFRDNYRRVVEMGDRRSQRG